jgi:hypothetical protein
MPPKNHQRTNFPDLPQGQKKHCIPSCRVAHILGLSWQDQRYARHQAQETGVVDLYIEKSGPVEKISGRARVRYMMATGDNPGYKVTVFGPVTTLVYRIRSGYLV